ncbi:FUSC family protein [Nonomuraea dietziae]|uniref:Putative membrane protein YccC n=1 Tax=Nonomuraea dietziae TaxID=65515 RepID=A0A7W5Y977_9ACTN|nr:FUSC family protein [Nonomuraea dietziae]MBB3729246.1 putative membrane protein YccC [Nonomuraea dietziae]
MRGAFAALRDGFSLPARPPWSYGVLCGTAVALPLGLGALAGAPHVGAIVALGAYYTAFGDTYGQPYGERAKTLFRAVPLVMLGFWVGAVLALSPWVAVAGIGLVAAMGAQWKVIGTPPVLAAISGFYAGLPPGLGPALQMGLGGVLFCALALALWPLRRLHPLKRALSQAAAAMADMLDGLAVPEEEWTELREEGSRALEAATTAIAAFNSSEESDRSPDRYADTLARIFHESVALRSLRAQTIEAGVEQQGLDEAVGKLSRALRESAEQESVVAVPGALAAVADFAERVTALRGRASPVQMALLGQVRRCMDRIAVAVRSVALRSSEGVRVPARLPQLTWRTPSFEGGIAHAARVGVAVAVSMALLVNVHDHFGRWMVFTVLIGLRPTYGDTFDRVVLRVAGTIVGSTAAAFLLAAVPGQGTLVAVVWIFAMLGFALREVSYAYWSTFATPLALMLMDFSIQLNWNAAGARVALTVAGGVLAVLAARLLWPRGEAGKVCDLVVDLLREHARMVRTLVDRDLDRLPDRTEAAGQAAEKLSESLDTLEKEPGGQAPEELRQAVTDARRLRDDTILLAAVMRGAPEGTDATVAILDAVADRMEAVAEAVRQDKAPPEADELDAGLADMASRVDTLVEEAEGGQAASVRRELRHAVAAHPALRTLTADALRLTDDVTR